MLGDAYIKAGISRFLACEELAAFLVMEGKDNQAKLNKLCSTPALVANYYRLHGPALYAVPEARELVYKPSKHQTMGEFVYEMPLLHETPEYKQEQAFNKALDALTQATDAVDKEYDSWVWDQNYPPRHVKTFDLKPDGSRRLEKNGKEKEPNIYIFTEDEDGGFRCDCPRRTFSPGNTPCKHEIGRERYIAEAEAKQRERKTNKS